MKRLRSLLSALRSDQRGLTTVEYAIILCVIVAVSVKAWDEFGQAIKGALTSSTADVNEAFEPGP